MDNPSPPVTCVLYGKWSSCKGGIPPSRIDAARNRGEEPKYCSDACKQAAYRERKKGHTESHGT